MVWKGLSEEVFAGWLASIICCVSSEKPQTDDEGDIHLDGGRRHDVSEKTMEICYDQPGLITPLRPKPRHQRSGSRSSILASQLMARSKSLALEASQSGKVMIRRMTGEPRRPTISAPSSFRHLAEKEQSWRHDGFRPLELSIYLPHNRLSPLPDFSTPDHGSVLAPRTFSVQSVPSSEFQIARKPLKPSVDLSLCDINELRIVDTRSSPSVVGFKSLVQPLRARPSLPASLDASHGTVALNSKQLPKPPSTLRACSYTGPICQVARRDSDPFVSGHDQSKRERALSGGILSGNPGPNMFGATAIGAANINNVYPPTRPRSPRISIMARPHPLKPLPPLPLSSIPLNPTSVWPSTTGGRDSYRESSSAPEWAIPPLTEQDNQPETESSPPPSLADSPARRPSTASTMYTGYTGSTLSYPSTPPTVSPQSSPGRPTPIKQRTFGFIEAKSHFETINEVHVDQGWMADRASTLDRFTIQGAVGVV